MATQRMAVRVLLCVVVMRVAPRIHTMHRHDWTPKVLSYRSVEFTIYVVEYQLYFIYTNSNT